MALSEFALRDAMIDENVDKWMGENFDVIESALLSGLDRHQVREHLRKMGCPGNSSISAENPVMDYIVKVENILIDEKQIPGPVNYVAECESEACGAGVTSISPDAEVPTPVAHRTLKLNFRLVVDLRPRLNDRIILSLAWKWAHCNIKKPRMVSVSKYRKATGFRSTTIQACLARLILWGFLTSDHKPLVAKTEKTYVFTNGSQYLGHRKLIVSPDGGIRQSVFRGVWSTNTRAYHAKPAWIAKALGVSRWTASRYISDL